MSGDMDKLNRFREAFERGQRGEIGSFDIWLRDRNFVPNRIEYDYLEHYFAENPQETTGHQEDIEKLAEYAGFASHRGGKHHISVVGASGMGKTHLLHTLSSLLSSLDSDPSHQYIDAEKLGNKEGDTLRLFELVERYSDMENAVLLIDNCGWDKQIRTSLDELSQATDSALVVSTWEPESWHRDQGDVNEVLSITNELHLEPFSESTMLELLLAVFRVASDDQFRPSEDYVSKIQEYSHGIPRIGIILAIESLRETFLRELELNDPQAVKSAAEKSNILGMRERIYGLSDMKTTILRHILLSYDRRGTRPSKLVDLLDRDKSTISYHLRMLSEQEIIKSDKQGRQVFYKLRDAAKPFVQIRIDEESA